MARGRDAGDLNGLGTSSDRVSWRSARFVSARGGRSGTELAWLSSRGAPATEESNCA